MENFDTTKEGKLKCKICKSRLKGHVGGLAKHLCLRHNKNFINSEQTNAEINLNTQEHMSLEEMYNKLFGPDHNDDVPKTQGYDHYLSAGKLTAEYEHETQKAIEESVREMPRGRGGPVIRDRGEQSKRGKEKIIEASSDSD
uniref:BED-type domain-containing protein n=1 Tax=Meloidogyne floridensis TaxID=298350 RepID=A0A915P9R7_9BILA